MDGPFLVVSSRTGCRRAKWDLSPRPTSDGRRSTGVTREEWRSSSRAGRGVVVVAFVTWEVRGGRRMGWEWV